MSKPPSGTTYLHIFASPQEQPVAAKHRDHFLLNMPTATGVNGLELVNLGPLTTTFTAPESCTKFIGLAPVDTVWFTGRRLDEQCTGSRISLSDCWPSGSVVDEDVDTRWSSAIYYHSPGYFCPSGWTTAGSVLEDGDGQITTSWDFGADASSYISQIASNQASREAASETLPGPGVLYYQPGRGIWHARLAEALSPGETGIACCPNSFTPMLDKMSCYSLPPVTSYTASTACESRYTFVNGLRLTEPISAATLTDEIFGVNVTAEYWVVSEPSLEGFSTVRTVQREEDGFWFIMDGEDDPISGMFTPIYETKLVLLAHEGPTHDSGDSSPKPTESEDSIEASETGEAENDENASGDSRGGVAGKILVVMGTWIVTMALGAALFMPL